MYLTYLMFDSLKQLTDSLHSKKSVQRTRSHRHCDLENILFNSGLPPTRTLTIKQFSLTVQDDYFGHESTKIRMAHAR